MHKKHMEIEEVCIVHNNGVCVLSVFNIIYLKTYRKVYQHYIIAILSMRYLYV